MFDQDVPALLAAIRQAVDANDGTALSRAAHTLRGSLVSFAAGDAVRAAQALETAGRDGQLSGARADLASLEAAMARLMPDLRALRSASA
jgi:HPt (histidine-containing phosphotransfer) domain-containing protein